MDDSRPSTVPFGGTIHLRRVVPAAIIVVALLVGYSALRDGDPDARAALETANRSYLSVLDDVGSAQRVQAVANVAPIAQAQGKSLARAAESLGDSAAEAAVGEVIQAQSEVLLAFGGLASLGPRELSAWGPQEDALGQARERLVRARAEVLEEDVPGGQDVEDPAKAIDHVRTLVGTTATKALTTTVLQLVESLGQVSALPELRLVGTQADAEGAVVDAARDGLSGRNELAVRRAGEVLSQLARLQGLTPALLPRWDDVRVRLLGALTALQGADQRARSLGEAGPAAVAHIDQYVQGAEAELAQWRSELAAARAQLRADLVPVQEYVRAMNAFHRDFLLTSWPVREVMREAQRDVESGAGVNKAAVEAELRQVLRARYAVLDGLETTPMPADLEVAHRDLAREVRRNAVVIERGIADLDGIKGPERDQRVLDLLDRLDEQVATAEEDYAFYRAAYRTDITKFVSGIRDRPLPSRPAI